MRRASFILGGFVNSGGAIKLGTCFDFASYRVAFRINANNLVLNEVFSDHWMKLTQEGLYYYAMMLETPGMVSPHPNLLDFSVYENTFCRLRPIYSRPYALINIYLMDV